MPKIDGEAATTRLLTLLNVSATKAGKRKRPAYDSPTTSVKLNKRNGVQFASPTAAKESSNSNSETEATKPVGELKASKEDDLPPLDSSEEGIVARSSSDPYTLHFGSNSAHLTSAAGEDVDERRWRTKRRKLAHLGNAIESVPESSKIEHNADSDAVLDNKVKSATAGDGEAQLSRGVLSAISSYQDFYHTRTELDTAPLVRRAVGLHCLNHIHKKRRVVLKNNERLANASKEEPPQTDLPDVQDQGFTRPSILIILPFRNSAFRWVNSLTEIVPSYQVENHARFQSDFALPPGAIDKLATAEPGTRPRDLVEVFTGNVDDNFRVGIKLTRKSFKLFSDFYSSDIIIASPLGLRLAIEKEKTGDFLSSIEVLVMDQMDVLTMQNWDHVQFVMSRLNQIPKENHNTDFARVKPWYLDGQAALLRQSILLTAFETPDLRALFNNTKNVAGKVRTEQIWPPVQVPEGLRQDFVQLECSSPRDEAEKRFDHFTKQLFPSVLKSAVQSVHTLIFVPSYFDFVRLQNHLKQLSDLSFAVLSEYSSTQDISRSRQAFFAGTKSVLVMTERFYFFRRYRIRGIRNLIFYAPPDHPQFYTELLSFPFIDEGVDASDVTCRVLFSKFDFMRLERIAGSAGVDKLIKQ